MAFSKIIKINLNLCAEDKYDQNIRSYAVEEIVDFRVPAPTQAGEHPSWSLLPDLKHRRQGVRN